MNVYIEEKLALERQRTIRAAPEVYSPAAVRRRPSARRILLVLSILLFVALALATPVGAHQLDGVLLDGSTRNDSGNAVAVDGAGNRYLVGTFQGSASFGAGGSAQQLVSRGADDAFVARYDATGNLAWVRQVGGVLGDFGRGVALGSNDALYVAGQFSSSVNLGGVTLSSRGQQDGFLARYDRDGTLRWAVQVGSTAGDAGFAVANISGDVILVGAFSGEARLTEADGGTAATLTSAGGSDILVARYSAAGDLVWARQAGGSGNDAARAVAVDGGGDLFVTGGFNGSATFASSGAPRQLVSAGLDDLFVASYSSAGDLRWVSRAGGSQIDRGLGIALGGNGNSYVTGFFTGAADVGERTFAGRSAEILLAQLDRDGRFVRATSAGGAGTDEGRGVAVAPNGTIYLTGRYQDTALFGEGANQRELRQRDRFSDTVISAFTAAYDGSFKPVFLEGSGFEASGEQSGNAVAADGSSRAHVTGIVQDVASFGVGSTIESQRTAGLGDVFLVTYSTGTPREVFYVSSSSGGTIDGVGFADEDVLAYDPANNRWSVLIDGSDIGLANADIDAFEWRPDGTQLLSLDVPMTLPGIPFSVDDSDIVRFVPSQLGATTAGRFEFFFDGSDVGLDDASEDIDAIGIRSDGRLVVSTEGAARVPGRSGEVAAQDADLLLCGRRRRGSVSLSTV